MNNKIIPREYYKTFILAGKADFVAHCALTNNSVHFFVRKRKESDMYNVYIWNDGWYHIACYFDNIMHVYTESKQYRNALKAVFSFDKAPNWLTLTHCDRCPRCGRKVSKSRYGFGEECWKKTFEQLKWRYE